MAGRQEVRVYSKQLIQDGRIHVPFDRELINELNVGRYQLTKKGHVQFSHPDGTHDDGLRAFALAVYTSRLDVPEYYPVAATGKI